MRIHEKSLGLKLDLNVGPRGSGLRSRLTVTSYWRWLDRLKLEVALISHNYKLEILGFNAQFL